MMIYPSLIILLNSSFPFQMLPVIGPPIEEEFEERLHGSSDILAEIPRLDVSALYQFKVLEKAGLCQELGGAVCFSSQCGKWWRKCSERRCI